MSLAKELYILGYSGHAYVVIDVARSMGMRTVAYFDRRKALNNPYKLNYLGPEGDYHDRMQQNVYVFPALGENSIRKTLIALIREKDWQEVSLIDATAKVSPYSQILRSTLVGAGAIINSMAKIGDGCIVNSGAIIEHECSIGSLTHVAPGAILAGGVSTGEACFIGAGAVVKQGVRIGNRAIIGAGTVVLNDIPSGETWVGNPSRKLKK